MSWTLTRTELLTGETLSREEFPDLDALIAAARARGVPLTDEHVAAIAAHPDTQFDRTELVLDGAGVAAYSAGVRYDLRPTVNVPPPAPRRETIRCQHCGTVGVKGGYPFSTLPPSARCCDDCA